MFQVSIVLGILCLIFAASVLAYIINSFLNNTSGPFDFCGETRSEDEYGTETQNLPINLQQLVLQQQLRLAEQREQEAQREKTEAARQLTTILRNSSVPPTQVYQKPVKMYFK